MLVSKSSRNLLTTTASMSVESFKGDKIALKGIPIPSIICVLSKGGSFSSFRVSINVLQILVEVSRSVPSRSKIAKLCVLKMNCQSLGTQ